MALASGSDATCLQVADPNRFCQCPQLVVAGMEAGKVLKLHAERSLKGVRSFVKTGQQRAGSMLLEDFRNSGQIDQWISWAGNSQEKIRPLTIAPNHVL